MHLPYLWAVALSKLNYSPVCIANVTAATYDSLQERCSYLHCSTEWRFRDSSWLESVFCVLV